MARRRRDRPGVATRPSHPLAGVPRHILLLALLTLAILILPLLRPAASAPEQRADGYSSIVAAAIERSWLYPVPDEGGAGGDVDGRVERARGGDVPGTFDQFIAASFLREDMNTLDPSIWRYDGNRLEIDPRAHLISGAYGGSGGGWRGSILYADQQVEQQLLDERGTPAAWLVPSPRPGAAARPRQFNLMAAPTGEASTDAATDLTFVANLDGAPTAVATIRRIGAHALLRVPRRDRAQVTVSIGTEDAAPAGAYQVGWRLLESGDTLSFTWPGGARRFQFVQTEPAISRARGDAARIRDPALDSFARPIEAAVGTGSQSLQTSINSRLQAVAHQALVDQSMALYGSEGITSFRSAAVLMDGITGEVAALPSFPVVPDHLHPSQRGSPSHRKMLERNSNFVRLVAGSAAKPPMAMAILNSYPLLAELRVPASTPFRTLLGIDLGTPVPDQSGDGIWDFRTFLARSSNKYAAMLMLLALSDSQSIRANECDGPSNEPFSIAGQTRTCRPKMRFMEGAQPGPFGVRALRAGQPAGQGWSNNLYSLFCISPNGPDERPAVPDPACMADDAQRHAIWRGALFQRPRLLAAASPDREGFGLNVVDSLYEDYVMTILGGNRGRWTTIGLAQAFSRILTGRAVTARLTPHGAGDVEEEPAPALQINAQAQARLADGLKAVVMEGTGRALLSAGFPAGAGGDEFRFFAKTGTPNVSFLGDDSRQLLQDFASAGCGLRLAVRQPRANTPGRAELTIGDNPALPAAQAIAAREDCRGRFGASAARIAELVRTINRSPSALAQVRADATGRVTDIPAQIALGEGTGNLLVLMVGRYRPGTPDTQPCSLRTIAINFQARTGQTRTPAMLYALSLLRNELTRSWFMGTPCGQGQPA